MGARDEALAAWAESQRALARALGVSIETWLAELDRAAARGPQLTAAVIGAASANRLGLSVLDRLDPPALAARARALIDPAPPRVTSPVLAEAIRRKDELPSEGAGARRLRRGRPDRVEAAPLPSAPNATPDAPGDEGEP